MDQNEFSRRLRLLAGPNNDGPIDQTLEPYTQILGSLGLAKTARRLQAAALSVVLGAGSIALLMSLELVSSHATWAVALALAAVTVVVVRRFPFWTPAGALRDGLVTLSRYQLNDLDAFLKHQRTNLTAVNNTLLSDLCMQLAMDRRRSQAYETP